MEVRDIPIAKIRVSANRRSATPSRVQSLVESIREIGLQHPIGVVPEDNGYRLVHGRHRLMAFSAMGRLDVPCVVMDLDAMLAELAELDENLCRAGLTKAEEAKALARRKEIYEALHPETKHGATGRRGSGKGETVSRSDKMSFSEDTAAKTGKSKRSVERDTALGNALDDDAVAKLQSHPIADNKAELSKLAKLPAKEQKRVAEKLARGQLQRVPDAEQAEAEGKIETDTFWQKTEVSIRKWIGKDAAKRSVAAARLENLAEKLRHEAT